MCEFSNKNCNVFTTVHLKKLRSLRLIADIAGFTDRA